MTVSGSDLSWRRLYRAGAWASLAYVILVLVPLALLFLAPVPPASGAAVLDYIGAHRVVYLVELVCFVGLSIPAIVVFCSWTVALWPVDRSLALVGGVFGVGSEITALAVGSSPQSLNGACSCSATPTNPRPQPSNTTGWPAPPMRSSRRPTPCRGRVS